jgi:hypothetical protein
MNSKSLHMFRLANKKLQCLLRPLVLSFRLPLQDVIKKKVSGIVEQEVVRLNKRSDTGFSGLLTLRCPARQFLLVLNLNVRQKRRWKRKKG